MRDAARLYRAGLDANRPLDAIVATYLREHLAGRPDQDRAFVVDAAHNLWRHRRLVDAIAARLDGVAKDAPEAVVVAGLIACGTPAERMPVARAEADAIVRIVNEVVAKAPLDVRASLPPWLCARLVAHGGEALALSSTSAPPQTLRVNTLKTTRDALIATLGEDGIRAVACRHSPVGVVVVERSNIFRTAAWKTGLFEVQDEGSQLIALVAGAAPGQRVVDGCAGAGGKTLALAAAMQNKGTLLALDVHSGRLKALQERTARAGVHNVRVHDVETDKKALKRLRGQCDVVVVDAPCSGSGVLRRNPDTGWRLTANDVVRLQGIQSDLLRRHAALVKPGGVLVYATCSLLDDENAKVVDAFVAEDAAFARVSTRDRLKSVGVDVDGLPDRPEGDLSLNPVEHQTDGFYAAVLRRT